MRVRENEISQKHGKQIKCKKWIVHYFNSFWAQVVNFGKVRQDSFQTDRQSSVTAVTCVCVSCSGVVSGVRAVTCVCVLCVIWWCSEWCNSGNLCL